MHDAAASAVTALAGVLKGSAGMAGTDNGGHEWALKYDPFCGGRDGAAGVMEQATMAVIAAGQCADLLHATAVNHSNADEQSAVNSPNAPAFPPDSVPMFPVPAIPSAEGGHADVPEWWHTIAAYVQGEMWPNGHQDQLHAAAAAWRDAGTGLRNAASQVNGGTSSLGVIAPLMDQKSPEMPAVIANCTQTRDAMISAADGCDVAAKACDDYASAIDKAHSDVLHEMAVLGTTVVVTEVVAAVLIPFTAGASEAVSKVVDVARLVATGERIAALIREFRIAAEASSMPTVSAAAAAARSIGEMAPLLEARVMLFAAETSGVVTDAGLDLLSRPYIRVGTRRAVEDAARKTPDGKYYISATDEDVLIPVSKQYDQDILNLPKTADGKYYQGADGIKYPVDPVYHLGHMPNDEWWRIRDQAIREHWTREQLNNYVNNPNLYRIEDAPGNLSHKYELPREAK
ncbi:HNH/ENDO VII family nuclease [Mycolicibacterium cosmeticum]|uniref:HNH/ENDO VII family nuclease n=1 Tax=Mycolicibacterium cosmeticum TaxID=258533 RepID=UPI003204D26C